MTRTALLHGRRERMETIVRFGMRKAMLLGAVALLVPVSAALAVGRPDENAGPAQDQTASALVTANMPQAGAGVSGDSAASIGEALSQSVGDPLEKPLGSGEASYYGVRFAGRPTASGEPFDPVLLTAAHRTLPFGSRVKVTNKRNGKSVVVRINDRGPFHGGRIIDLSKEAAEKIGLLRRGQGLVELALLVD